MESSMGRGGLERVSAAGLGVEVEAQRARRAVTTRDDVLRCVRAFTALKATLDDERYISTKLGEFSKTCPLYSADFTNLARAVSGVASWLLSISSALSDTSSFTRALRLVGSRTPRRKWPLEDQGTNDS